jgi:hypothetical protein
MTCLAAAVAVAHFLGPDTRTTAAASDERSGPPPWRNQGLLFLLVTNVVFAAGYLQVGISLPLTLQHRGIGASGYGVILVTLSVVGIAALPILRPGRTPRETAVSHTRQIVGGYLLLAAGFAGYGVARTLTGFLCVTVVVGVGEVLLSGHVLALVSALAPPYRRARCLATFGLSWGLAAALGPVPATLLLEHGGDQLLWCVVAGCCAAVAGAHAAAARRLGAKN